MSDSNLHDGHRARMREKYTEKVWGRHPSKISADWGVQRVKGLSILTVIKNMLGKKKNVETSLIEEFWYPKYGPGQLWETLAEEIEKAGGVILKEYNVKRINIENRKIKSVECIVNGNIKEIRGDIFISSMPLKDLVSSFKGEEIPNKILFSLQIL